MRENNEQKNENDNALVKKLVAVIVVLVGVIVFREPGSFKSFLQPGVKQEHSSKIDRVELSKPNTPIINKKEDFKLRPLHKSDCLNQSGEYRIIDYNMSRIGLSARQVEDRTIEITVNNDKYFPKVSNDFVFPAGKVNDHIVSFDKDIADFGLYGFGQVAGEESLVCIMSDGTIEYINIFESLKKLENEGSEIIREHKKLSGVSGIYKVREVGAYVPRGGGWNTFIGIKKDGSFYDLGRRIHDSK